MTETPKEYALRIARGCARGIALETVDEFKRALEWSFRCEVNLMASIPTRRMLREQFEQFTSEDFETLHKCSAYR